MKKKKNNKNKENFENLMKRMLKVCKRFCFKKNSVPKNKQNQTDNVTFTI